MISLRASVSLWFILLLARPLVAAPEIPGKPQDRPIALVGGTVHPVSGPAIETGTVLFEKGKLTSIGKDAKLPPGTEKIDVAGKHVYPGLIDAYTSLGLVEIDAVQWALKRRVPAGEGIYNLAASPDGELVVATNKKGQSVSVFEAASGKELARIPTTRRLPSGVAISGDSRYAFVTLEGVGSEPGAVDVIDLVSRTKVATADVGQQAGGIAALEPSAP